MKRLSLAALLLVVVAFGAGFLGGTLAVPKPNNAMDADMTEFRRQAVEKNEAAQRELDEARAEASR